MNQKEKLSEIIKDWNFDATICNSCNQSYSDCLMCSCKELADYLLANGVIVLPCKPLPCEKDRNPMNTNIYCPYCGTSISGCYPNCEIDVVPCVECGTLLDITKTVTREEAEKALREREDDA